MGRLSAVPTRIAHGRDEATRPNIGAMQIIGAAPPTTRSRFPSLVIGATAGTILIVSGLTFEFATLVTPYFDRVARGGFGASAGPSGTAAWFAAVLLGAVFLGVGAARLAGLLADVRPGLPRSRWCSRPGTAMRP